MAVVTKNNAAFEVSRRKSKEFKKIVEENRKRNANATRLDSSSVQIIQKKK